MEVEVMGNGASKSLNHSALKEAVVHVFDNLDPAMDEFEKKHFLIKVYSRYYETTRHMMHSRGQWPIERIASSIPETTIKGNGWRTVTRHEPIFNADGDKENMKYKRYLKRLVQ
jgi:hypothetical protein